MVIVYNKLSITLDRESVKTMSQEISELLNRLYNHEKFNHNVKYLKSRGITHAMLTILFYFLYA